MVFDRLFGEKALLHRLKGTLFLDHIEALSPPAQHQLYRFLYNQRYAETVSVWVLAGCEQEPVPAAGQTAPPAAPFAGDPEEVQIRRLLRAHYGSRSEVAAILGISTTTLWRKMKKYGLT